MSQEVKLELGALREASGRAILAGDPDIGVRDFTRRIQHATSRSMSESTAQALLKRLRAETLPAADSQESVLPTPLADALESQWDPDLRA